MSRMNGGELEKKGQDTFFERPFPVTCFPSTVHYVSTSTGI